MHRKVRRAAAKALALVLALSVAGVAAPDSQAAKKPKLSPNKVTVSVKKSKKVTIKNVKAKQVKKLAVTSSKKSIATVKKNGKTAFTITGKKAGKATVTAKLTLKGKKKATSLKVKVTVKGVVPPTPTSTPTVSAAPTTVPSVSTTPQTNPGIQTPVPTVDPNGPKYTAAPNAGVKRITSKSNGIIDNITLWGVRDNPYAEVGYDFTQYGRFSGLFTKWYEPKDAFKALHELFSAGTAKSLKSMKLMAADEAGDAPLYTVGESSATVKSIVTTGKYDWDTKEVSEQQQHSVEFTSRTSEGNAWDDEATDEENEGKQKLTVVDGETLEATDGGNGPAVYVTGRKNNWHGIQVDITDFLADPTKDYRLSMDVTHKTASNNGADLYTQIIYQDEVNGELVEREDRPMLVMQRAAAGQWTTFATNYSRNGVDADRVCMCINWYGEGAGDNVPHNDFYIKNVSVYEIASDKVDDPSETLTYSPLYENTENFGFSFGGVIDDTTFKSDSYKQVMQKHFASITTGNELKMYALLDEEATKASPDGMPVLRKDSRGEEMVKWAYENGIGVRGHTIICDTAMDTNCKYFFHEDYDTSKKLAEPEVVLARYESFITQCITYFEQKYPGTIHTWDLVNEAIEPGNCEKDDDRKIQKDNNMFYDTIGSDYVEYAFLYARRAVNQLKKQYPDRDINIKLFYNDFNCFQRTKRDAICALVKSIQEFGEEQGEGSLIDGVGMQCYIGGSEFKEDLLTTNTKRTADSIPNSVFMFKDLGMKVQFTELTVRSYDESKNAEHAEYFKKFMQMAIDINNGTIEKVLD